MRYEASFNQTVLKLLCTLHHRIWNAKGEQPFSKHLFRWPHTQPIAIVPRLQVSGAWEQCTLIPRHKISSLTQTQILHKAEVMRRPKYESIPPSHNFICLNIIIMSLKWWWTDKMICASGHFRISGIPVWRVEQWRYSSLCRGPGMLPSGRLC